MSPESKTRHHNSTDDRPLWQSRLVHLLIEPADAISDVAIRHKSRLLAYFLLGMTVVFAVMDTIQSVTVPGYVVPWYGYVFLLTAYTLNRTRHYTWAAGLTMVMFPTVVFAMVFSGASVDAFRTMGYLILGLMAGSILLPVLGTVILAAVNIAGILLVPVFAPSPPAQDALLDLLARNVIAAVLAMVFIRHRDQVEHERQAQLRSAEQRYRSIFENAILGIFQTTPEGQFLSVNPAMARILGYETPEELVANIKDIPNELYVVPDQRQAAVDRLLNEHEIREYESQVRRRDGSLAWVSEHTRLVWNDQGDVLYLEGTAQDITERKHVTDLLEQEQTLYQRGPAVIFRWSATRGWPVEYVSPNVSQFGYTVRDLVGGTTTYREIVDPRDRSRVFPTDTERAMAEHQETGLQYSEQDYRIVCANGEVRWVHDYTRLIRNDDGELTGYHGYILDITQHKMAEERVRDLLERTQQQALQVQQIVDTVPEGVILLDLENRVILANPAAQSYLPLLTDSGPDRVLAYLGDRALDELLSLSVDDPWLEISAGDRVFEVGARPIEAGSALGTWVLVLRDVTQERIADRRARQQERLVTVGQLAAGVAHDFNNLLTAITGYASLLMDSPQLDAALRTDVAQIADAADRASSLTNQLLAFSRQQVMQPRILNLNQLVRDMQKMLGRLISESIALETDLAERLGRVEADPGQIEQVIVNLAVNARDAMPDGGRLVLKTANVILDGDYVGSRFDLPPGPYVSLTVSDTGIGMTPEVLSHIFEPFFTTKGVGEGTGLGLATVHGIVRQSGGDIHVYSEPGKGSVFRVYLPRVDHDVDHEDVQPVAPIPQGTETVLLVEDEEAVRDLAGRLLTLQGYTVLSAPESREALEMAASHEGTIDLLVTDVVMPGLGGRDVARGVRDLYPQIRVLYISGYTDEVVAFQIELEAGSAFLQKPFTPSVLGHKVREVLDAD